jgi:hypothetical protein
VDNISKYVAELLIIADKYEVDGLKVISNKKIRKKN